MASDVQVIDTENARPTRMLLFKAGLGLAVVRIGLICMPFHRLRRGLIRLFGENRCSRAPAPVTIARAVARMSASVPGATCLVASLVCELMLLRHGHAPRLHVGVMVCPDHELEAHAWVECDGKTILGDRVNTANFRTLLSTGE